MVKRKRTNNDLQNTTQKAKDRTTGIHQKPDVNSSAITYTLYIEVLNYFQGYKK
jgi:hypothetical protein